MARRSRRKKSSSSPLPILLGVAGALGVAAIGFMVINKGEQPSAKKFPLETYVNSSNSLRGNEYSISGEIIKNAAHDPAVGKYIFLRVDTGEEEVSSDIPKSVGIIVPSDVSGPNLETKQKYTFVVDVKKEGQLVANSYSAN